MADEFSQFLTKLIAAEDDRIFALKAEETRRQTEAAKEMADVEALQPRIFAKMQEVSALWGRLAGEINNQSRELGLSADVSGWQDGRNHHAQVNFHSHGPKKLDPLQLSVGSRGMGMFTPNRSTSFDFLRSGDGVFEGNLKDHVKDLFHQVRNDAISAARQA